MMVRSPLIALFFSGVFAFVFVFSWSLLEISDDTLLTKIGTMASIGSIFLGTYITVWLINQNRSKIIEENYFYKVELLTVINVILCDVAEFNKNFEIIVKKNIKNTKPDIHYQQKRELDLLVSQYEKLITSINFHIPAPTNVRSEVKLLLFKIFSSIMAVVKDSKPLSINFGTQLWVDQHNLFNLPYFTADRDEHVQKKLKEMKDRWHKIKPR